MFGIDLGYKKVNIDVTNFSEISASELGGAANLSDALLTVTGQGVFREINESKTSIIDGTIDKTKLDEFKKQLYTNIVKISNSVDSRKINFSDKSEYYYENKNFTAPYEIGTPESKEFLSKLQKNGGSTLLADSIRILDALDNPADKLVGSLDKVVDNNIDQGVKDLLRTNLFINGKKIYLNNQKNFDGLTTFLKDQGLSDKDVDYLFANLNQKAITAIPADISNMYHTEDNKISFGLGASCNPKEINLKVGPSGMESLTCISGITYVGAEEEKEVSEVKTEVKFDKQEKDKTIGKEYKGYALPGSVKPLSVNIEINMSESAKGFKVPKCLEDKILDSTKIKSPLSLFVKKIKDFLTNAKQQISNFFSKENPEASNAKASDTSSDKDTKIPSSPSLGQDVAKNKTNNGHSKQNAISEDDIKEASNLISENHINSLDIKKADLSKSHAPDSGGKHGALRAASKG